MLVGSIQNYAKGNTNVSCSVEDGTGTIDVRLWVENPDEDSGKLEGVESVIASHTTCLFSPIIAGGAIPVFS